MEMHYLMFCQPGSPYYDVPAPADDDFDTAGWELPEGWQRRSDKEWVNLVPPTPVPSQGWKIHVSATLDNAERILRTTWDYCTASGVMFKYIRGRSILIRRNSKYGDRGSSGKFITIYPVDETALARILTELGDRLDGERGPYILSDLRWRSGPLYVRYGGFAPRLTRTPTGELVHCIVAPDGTLVPDVRGPSFKPPSWVEIPECLHEAIAARNAGTLKNFPFKPTRALHFSNGGGVYLATYLATGETVLLKEARPLAGLDEAGRDAVARLEQERWALSTLAGVDGIPRLIDYRIGHEHYFLAREYVEGTPLTQEIQRRNPLVNSRLSLDEAPEYTKWSLGVLDQVEQAMRAMHARGVVFGDLHPNNILIRPDGTIAFIDLETASDASAHVGQAIGAPGFRAPMHYRGTAVDEYALGCLRLAIFAPITLGLAWGPEKVGQAIDIVTRHFPVPDDFADRVWADLGPQPYPTVADARAAAEAEQLWTAPGQGQWPALRDELVASLLASAEPHREDRLYPGDVRQFRAPDAGMTFGNGAAGVLWSLAQLGAAVPQEHVEWLVAATRRMSEPRPGFFDGLPGVAMALDRLGRRELAVELLDRAARATWSESDLNLYSGLSGLGLTVLHFAQAHGDDSLTATAVKVAEEIARRGEQGLRAVPAPGLLTGASGIGLFLLRLYEATGDATFRDQAAAAVRQDLAALGWSADAKDDTGEDGMELARAARAAGPGQSLWRTPLLGAGGAGTAMVLHDLTSHLPDVDLLAARDALARTLDARFMVHCGILRGRAGAMIAMRRLNCGDLSWHAETLGWHAVRVNGRLAFLGDNSLRLSMDFGTGLAGVLLALQAALSPADSVFPFFGSTPRA